MKSIKPKLCYLCGEKLDYINDNLDDDHVPPRQFYAKEIRKNHNLNLFTIIVHKSWPPDEFFFIYNNDSKGDYPGVFDYKYKIIKNDQSLHFWAFLLWDRIIMLLFYFTEGKFS